jgi:hypothetical protein
MEKLMSKASERERIEALEAKLKQLKVQQQRKDARARTVASRRARHDELRGEELRRKILAGAMLLSKVEANEFDEAVLQARMDRSLTRADDRALFWLDQVDRRP